MLGADPAGAWRAEIALQDLQHRLEHRGAGNADLAAGRLEPLAEIAVDQRVEDDARRFLEVGDDPVELLGRAHQRVDVLDGADVGVLRRSGASDRDQRFAGRVRNHVEVEEAFAVLHAVIPSPVDESWIKRR